VLFVADRDSLFVVHVAASVAPQDGGPTTCILSVNNEWPALGVASVIVTTDADGLDRRLPVRSRWPLEVDGSIVLFHRVHPPRRFKASVEMLVTLFRLIRRADVVHIHGLYLFSSLSASLIARLFRRPVFLQPHGVLEPYQRTFRSVWPKRIYDALGGRWALRAADGVIFASTSEAENARDLVPEEKAFIVPLGATVDEVPESFTPSWDDVVPSNRPIVLFLGRVAPKKRLDLLLDAWPAVALEVEATLVIAGPYEADDRRRMEGAAPRSDVVWLGPVSGPDRDALLRRASLFVLPSENENFAIAVAESLVAGTPALVTRAVAMSEIVERTASGVVLEQLPTADELASAITSTLRDHEALRALADNASTVAAPQLTWRRTAERLLAAYRTAFDTAS
jgi:glycosyltransferase involved in cell wall biosynthesis